MTEAELNKVWIYALTDPRCPDVYRYIGRSGQPRIRHLQHCQDYSLSEKCEWVESLRQDGVFPKMVLLEKVEQEQADEAESRWIQKHSGTITNTAGMTEASEQEEISDAVLANRLREWFSRVCGVSSQARRKNPVWAAIREIAGHWGNWRNAPRGDPKKGFEAMKKGEQ